MLTRKWTTQRPWRAEEAAAGSSPSGVRRVSKHNKRKLYSVDFQAQCMTAQFKGRSERRLLIHNDINNIRRNPIVSHNIQNVSGRCISVLKLY